MVQVFWKRLLRWALNGGLWLSGIAFICRALTMCEKSFRTQLCALCRTHARRTRVRWYDGKSCHVACLRRGLLDLRNDILHGTDDEYKCAICGLKSPSCIIACDSAGCAARMHLSCAPSGNQHVQKNGTLSVVCPRHSGSTDTSCPLLLTPEHSQQNQSFSGSEDEANRVSDIDLPTTHGVRLPTAGHRAGKGQRQTRRMNKGAQHSRSAVRTGAHKDEKAQHSALATDMELLRKAASTASTGVSAVLIDRPELDVLLSLPASFLCDPQLNWTVLFSQTLRTGYMRKRREMSWGKV